MIKRLMDIAIALAALSFLGPWMVMIAVRIRMDSPGGALFRQRRAGLGGRAFVMFKFRTMRTDVDPYGASPHGGNDPRLTRVGRWLRETSLDELPQLLNVLNGTMSLVGPRPLYERQAARWDERQRRRLNVKPGVTGWAQVEGRASLPIEDKIELDLYYVDHHNLRMDVLILFRTLKDALGSDRGVYETRYSREREHETDTPQA
jgi:lipopolysaccharide/colanic/teichoic acid biosynthesis glycosyltransferase